MDWVVKHGLKIARIIAGMVVLLVGLALLVLPGPGIPFVLAGLAILAVDFVWARQLKKRIESKTKEVVDKVRRSNKPPA